ncbi:MAG: amidohydrolase, partial [Acidobacteriota bacterium]
NGERDRRFRIEHAQVVPPEDLRRYKQLQVIASVQPSHCIDDMNWAEKRIGRERCRYAYQWKSFLDAGVKIAVGTDWYVEPLNPMLGLYAAVTRQTPEGSPPGGWFPEQRLTLEEAIRLYTLGSAFASFEEDIKGSIEEGKLADMVVLSHDIFKVPPPEILDTAVEITLLGGQVIYHRER